MTMEMSMSSGMYDQHEMTARLQRSFPGLRVLTDMPETLGAFLDALKHLTETGKVIISVTGLSGAGKNTVIESMDALSRATPKQLQPFLDDDTYRYFKEYSRNLERNHYSFSTTARAAKLPRKKFGHWELLPGRTDYYIKPNRIPGEYPRRDYQALAMLGIKQAQEIDQLPRTIDKPTINWVQSSSWTVWLRNGSLDLTETEWAKSIPSLYRRLSNQIKGNDRWASVGYYLANHPSLKRDTYTIAIIRDPQSSKAVLPFREKVVEKPQDSKLEEFLKAQSVRMDESPHRSEYRAEAKELSEEQKKKLRRLLPDSMMPNLGIARVDLNFKEAIKQILPDWNPNQEIDEIIQRIYYENIFSGFHIDQGDPGYGEPYGVIELNPYSSKHKNIRYMEMYENDDVWAKRYGLF